MINLRKLVKRLPLDLGNDKSIAVRKEEAEGSVIRFEANGRVYYIPCNLKKLEIFEYLKNVYLGAKSGEILGPMWINPKVKVSSLRNTELFALSYFSIKKFLGLANTRNMWMVLPKVSNTLITYLKDRVSFTSWVIPYKVAMITCWKNGYDLSNISEIEEVFESCGLASDNSIFYVLALMTGDLEDFSLLHDEPFDLSVNSLVEEADDFSNNPKTTKLCYFHAHKKLSFVAQSHKIDFSDLAVELMSNTLVAYRMVRPMQNKLYSENYARRAMTNTVNRILYAVSNYEHMIQVWQGEDGSFVSRNISLNESTEGGVSTGWLESSDAAATSLGFSEDVMINRIDESRGWV